MGTVPQLCIGNARGNVYVANRGNKRIQVFDNEGAFQRQISNVGAPMATLLGKFGSAGKLPKEFGTVNEIDCRNANELLVAEITNWRVQRLRLRP